MAQEPKLHASIWRKLGLVLVALLFITIAAVFAYREASGTGVQRELESIRSRGLPTSPAELNVWYAPVPASSNAALTVLNATEVYVDVGPNDPRHINFKFEAGQPLPSELMKSVTNLLHRNGDALAQLHRIPQGAPSRYPIDLTQGKMTLLPHLAKIKRLAELLKWEAFYQSASGDRAKALSAIQNGFALADTLSEEPVFISALVRMACLWITFQGLEQLVAEHALDEEELRFIAKLAAEAEKNTVPCLTRALQGERASDVPLFRVNYRTFKNLGVATPANKPMDAQEVKAMLTFEVKRLLGEQNRDLSFYLARMGEIERGLELPYPEMIREAQRIQKVVDDGIREGLQKGRYLMSMALMPALSVGVEKAVLLDAHLRCLQLACAVELLRLRNDGHLPSEEELEPMLRPETLKDPVDGSTLRYEKLSKGYRVVAIGATKLKAKRPTAGSTNTPPVAFTVARE